MQNYRSPADLEEGITRLMVVEPRFAGPFKRHGTPSLRASISGLEGLLMIVTEQFLSLHAAAAIWKRVQASIQPFSAENLLAMDQRVLQGLGLSQAKIKTFYATAQAVACGQLAFDFLHQQSDDDIRVALCALPGIGPWTSDIYLLSCLQRCDAWPAGDLALQVAAQDLFGLSARPPSRAMTDMAEQWRPHRAAAARLLWGHYRFMKGLMQA